MANDDSAYAGFGGNLDFRNDVLSADLNDNLQHMDIDAYLKQNKKNMIPHNLPIHLELLLEKKGLSKQMWYAALDLTVNMYIRFSQVKRPPHEIY